MKITLNLEGAQTSLASLLSILDDLQIDDGKFATKSVKADWKRNRCTVVLRQVQDALDLLGIIITSLKTLNQIHTAPVLLTQVDITQAAARSKS
ncbi:MAG: hypothetical protein ACOX0Y_02955 [Thiopseudomonas sp.]